MSEHEGEFVGATVVGIQKKRWEVRIHLRLPDGTEETLVASADRYFTDGDGIWFDTAAETEAFTSW